jgi:hypothetical protein
VMSLVKEKIKEKLEGLKKSKLGLVSASIYETDTEILRLPCEQRFVELGIVHDQIISTKVNSESACTEYGQSEDVAGKTTFYLLEGETRSAVFVIAKGEGQVLNFTFVLIP